VKAKLLLFAPLLVLGCGSHSVVNSTLIAFEHASSIELSVPASSVKMTIPKDDLVKMDNTGAKSYRYFIYSGAKSGFTLSGWFEPANQYLGLEKHWTDFLSSWPGNQPEEVSFSKVDDWETVSYHVQVDACKLQSIKAFLVHADTWIELHMTSPCNQSMDLKTYLKKIKIEQKN